MSDTYTCQRQSLQSQKKLGRKLQEAWRQQPIGGKPPVVK
jgi:hypothetical protein